MGHDSIKLELLQWLTKLEDVETLDYLKIIMDSRETRSDWWHDLTDDQKSGIVRGLADIDAGRVHSHDEVKLKLGI